MSAINGTSSAALARLATAAPQDAARHKRLVDAAQQFEAMFLQQLMKPFQGSDQIGGDVDGDGSAGVQGGTMQGLATESMARAIASAGGLGVARQVVAQVEREWARQHTPADTGSGIRKS